MAAIADRGAEALSDPVARHMTKNPKMAAEDDTVHSTMETMTIERFRHLPVIDRGDLSGSYPLATWSNIGSKRSNTNIRRCEIISPRRSRERRRQYKKARARRAFEFVAAARS